MIKNILLLCTMLAPLCVSAQQTLAEITQGHPKIENLIKYADSLGIHIRKGYRISNSDSGIRYDKTVKLDFVLGDTLPNSRHTVPHATSSLFLDSIRSTFMSLIPSASESYAREHHHNGTDSIIYIMNLGNRAESNASTKLFQSYTKGKNGSTAYQHPNVPENILFDYYSDANGREKGTLTYRYSHDLAPTQQLTFINAQEYTKRLEKVFDREDISRHHFYFRKDSTYQADYQDFRSLWATTGNWSSESNATVYTTTSKETAFEILHAITETTWQYLNERPNVYCRFKSPLTDAPFFCEILNSFAETEKGKYQDFFVQAYAFALSPDLSGKRHDDMIATYCFIISHAKTEGAPVTYCFSDYHKLKSWINGKKVYLEEK